MPHSVSCKYGTQYTPMALFLCSCADTCYQTFKDCNCCNSFSYNPAQKQCYLKNRTQDASIETLYNSDGWQSYWYGGIGFSNTGSRDAYKGDLPGTIIMDISWPGYRHYYVSVGSSKLAANEGEAIKTVEGYDYISNATPEFCAKGCDDTAECDGFSYNPFQDNGKCYLKKNTTNGRYTVVDSYEGWTFYWKDTSSVNCWCSCASEYACVGCDVWGACVAF
eukprot:TRINITY_DN6443_c1_g1_i6.p1 TRINITY_DN6443_c1_g1~~TRINITY_DN6443_c1_g1_i6.p1  ORF type:complete len:221 (-),score=-1.23 TRINITY_DN6443_c1_g1_i6:302-964(-)